MHNKISKILTVGAMVLLLTSSCSNKTNNSQSNPPNQQRGERPDSQGDRPNRQGQGMPNFDELLSKMDTNKDGKLSKEEAQGPLKNDFSKIDSNGDGYITTEEFKNSPPPPPRKN